MVETPWRPRLRNAVSWAIKLAMPAQQPFRVAGPKRVSIARVLFVAAFGVCVTCQFFAARCIAPISDTVQSFNEMLTVRAGHPLLPGWVLAQTTYYWSDLPAFVIPSLVLGMTPRLIYVAPALIFVAFLVAGCLLVTRQAAEAGGRRGLAAFATLYLLGLPLAPALVPLLVAAVHTAPLTLGLYAVLAAEPVLCGRPFKRWRLLPFGLLVFAAAASDPFTLVYLFAPWLLLIALRLWRAARRRPDEWLVVGVMLLALMLASGVNRAVAALGGFTVAPGLSMAFVDGPAALATNLHAVLRGLQQVFSARAVVLPPPVARPVVACSRLVAAGFVAALCARVIWRVPRAAPADGLVQLLVLGAVSLAALDLVSDQFYRAISTGVGFPNAATRYVVPCYVLASLAASLEARALLAGASVRTARLAIGLLCGLTALFAPAVVQVARQQAGLPPGIDRVATAGLAAWLAEHGFRHGVGDYWTSSMVTALSRGVVWDTPVRVVVGTSVTPFAWASDMSDLTRHRPEFAAFAPGNLYGVTVGSVTSAYGVARAVRQVGGYTVVEFAAGHD